MTRNDVSDLPVYPTIDQRSPSGLSALERPMKSTMIDSKRRAGLIGFMQGKASGKHVLLLFVLTMAVYLLMLLVTIPRVQSYAPDTALFDLSPTGYTHSQALALLHSLGYAGRDAYLFPQIALDFVYPALFASCYSLMLIWIYSKRVQPQSKLWYLAMLPALGGFFDYVENILVIRMITTFPDVTNGLVAAASSFTLLKSVFSTASFLLLGLGFALLLKDHLVASPQEGSQSRPNGQQDGPGQPATVPESKPEGDEKTKQQPEVHPQ